MDEICAFVLKLMKYAMSKLSMRGKAVGYLKRLEPAGGYVMCIDKPLGAHRTEEKCIQKCGRET